jgi:hypothetical protein
MIVVLQSFRSYDVPAWIQRCMASVRSWAEQRHFTYAFVGDELLALPPDWFRKKSGRYLNIVTDLGRLLCAREYLAKGAERVLWIDADVLIFQPDPLNIDLTLSYGYAKEAWCRRDDNGGISSSLKINNAACLFRGDEAGLAHLNGYIDDCLKLLQETDRVRDHTLIGTRYLSARNSKSPLPVLLGFGLLSPLVVRAILTSDSEVLAYFGEQHGDPIYAANLCNFFRGTGANKSGIADDTYTAVVNALLADGGAMLEATGLRKAQRAGRS